MKPFEYYIGIDIAKDDFVCSIWTKPGQPVVTSSSFSNIFTGFEQAESWLSDQGITPDNTVICLEATGVYGEALSYWFTAHRYAVAVEPPLKVKRAFEPKGHKNDAADSRQIAEYAFRFTDELHLWHPKEEVIEQIKVLLVTREQLVTQRTALLNTLQVLQRKVVQTPLANRIHQENIDRFTTQIKEVEKELKRAIDQHPDFREVVRKLVTIPGVGLLLAANFLTITDGFQNSLATNFRKTASFVGICPFEFQSGSSVFRRPKAPKFGPSRMRKLLHLAARSMVTHRTTFREYYLMNQAKGKQNRLILNNVANKLLKIMCAIVRTGKQYDENHVSINPGTLFKTA